MRGCARPPLRGDESEQFRNHGRLLALVAGDVGARPHVIQDDCAYASLESVARQPQRTSVVGRVHVVARREAIRLAQYDRRLVSLGSDRPDDTGAARRAGLDARDALADLAALPERKRSVLTLHVSGHSYGEIAAELA